MELKTSNLESKQRAFDDSISDIKEDLAELDSVTNALPEIQDKVKKSLIFITFQTASQNGWKWNGIEMEKKFSRILEGAMRTDSL